VAEKLGENVKRFDEMVGAKFDKNINVKDIMGYEVVSKNRFKD